MKDIITDFLDTCHRLQANGMTCSSGGNISVRLENGNILLTPSGRSFESLEKEDLITLHPDGSFESMNGGLPSKEWRMHLACYQRSDVNAVVHLHSISAVIVSCMKDRNFESAIPVYTPGYGMRVGHLPLLSYFTPGSVELSERVFDVLKDRNSVLLANHGSVTVGQTLETAVNIAEEIEDEAKIHIALRNNGIPLTEDEQRPLRKMNR